MAWRRRKLQTAPPAPVLNRGIFGSPITAILHGGVVIWRLEPGLMMFIDQQQFIWRLIASLYAVNFLVALDKRNDPQMCLGFKTAL
jgi:TctA family transporter